MICPKCHGKRDLIIDGRLRPCPECEGRGEIHCCEGLQAQPEEEDEPGEDETPEAPNESTLRQ